MDIVLSPYDYACPIITTTCAVCDAIIEDVVRNFRPYNLLQKQCDNYSE
jgi:hypothetical protein